MEEQNPIQWLKEIKEGSKVAFDRFYETYVTYVYDIAFSIVRNEVEAEDVCHDVFLEVYEKANQYSERKGTIKAWLAVKTKSRSIDRLRKNKRLLTSRLELLLEKEPDERNVEMQLFHSIERHIIFEALKSIPIEQQEVIIRSYYYGETHREIASTMNKPLGSVKSLIRYGINNLRKQKGLVQWIAGSRGDGK